MNCKIKSYNAVRAQIFGKKLTMVQWLILRRSSPHTHDEFVFSERYDNISFSATWQDKVKGVRFKQIKYSHRERWDTIIVPMTDEQEDKAYREARKLEGTLYDLIGQLSHLTKWKIWRPSKIKIWCSKTVGRLLYVSKPLFKDLLIVHDLVDELRPDQLHMMAKYFFGK